MKFFPTVYQLFSKKIKKKYVSAIAVYYKKCIFALPIRKETGAVSKGKERGEIDWGCSLKEWKDVANTQGFF